MAKTVVIHQPDFIPYPGFFHRLLHCDCFVLLDHVQFNRRGWHHRDKIKGLQGETWLSIPIRNIGKIKQIDKARIDNSTNWQKRHLNMLNSYYGKAKYFDKIFPAISAIYNQPVDLMTEFNYKFLKLLMELLDIRVDCFFSSDMQIQTKKNQMNVDIVRKIGGSRYFSGLGAKDYIDAELFKKNGIELVWQKYNAPVYPQLHGEFLPNLSSVDLLFNCGVEDSRKILRRC
ncbi:MAG: WbqC family protein [Candidatus Omnitrophica bacterium]|nr:WbqC family protein [Candidatus Omnitrophota bacterium]